MKTWVIIDPATGRVLRSGSGLAVPDGAVEAAASLVFGAHASQLYVDAAGVLRQRPRLPPPVETAGGVAVEGAAAATMLAATDGETTLETPVVNGAAALELTDGAWDVVVKGPWPWVSAERRVVRGAEAVSANLAGARLQAIARINAAIGARRKAFVTDIPAQEMLYLEKRSEALRYLAEDPEPEALDGYPLLAAEIGITAPTAWQLAQIWANQAAMLVAVAAHLETLRLGAIAAIETAATAEEIEAALDAFQDALSTEV